MRSFLHNFFAPSVQEVQSNHYTEFLQPELAKAGYTAIYKKKTMEIYTGNSYAIDGCATFFKTDRFALVKKYEVRHKTYSSILLAAYVLGSQPSSSCSCNPCQQCHAPVEVLFGMSG